MNTKFAIGFIAGCLFAGPLLSAEENATPKEPWLTELNRSKTPGIAGKQAKNAQGSTPYKDAQVGSQLAGYLDHDAILLDSPEITAYLQSIANKLLTQWKGPQPSVQFLLRSSAEPCAYSDVQQNVIVCTGFLNALENEDQLAALLGHELSHVLLGHAQDANMRKILPVGMEVVGTITAAVKQRQAGPANARLSPDAEKTLATTQLASTLWSDMLAPSWNRDQEREADRLGLDLMRAAGYNEGAFSAVLSQLDNVQRGRSARMELIRETVVAKTAPKSNAKQTAPSLADVGQQLEQQAAESFINNIFDGMNGYAQNYDPPNERLRLLQEYIAAVYTKKRRDKTAQADTFAATLRNGRGGQLLASDRKALAIRTALDGNDLRGALTAADAGSAETGGALSLALARSDAYLKSRRYEKALPLLESAAQSNYAPAAAYRELSESYRAQRKYPEALSALKLGSSRLGRETNFLADLVETSRVANDIDAAEGYAMKCNLEQQTETLKNPLSLLTSSVSKQPQQQQPTSLYAECTRRLGYDPIKKREAQAKQQQKAAPDLSKALKGFLGGK